MFLVSFLNYWTLQHTLSHCVSIHSLHSSCFAVLHIRPSRQLVHENPTFFIFPFIPTVKLSKFFLSTVWFSCCPHTVGGSALVEFGAESTAHAVP